MFLFFDAVIEPLYLTLGWLLMFQESKNFVFHVLTNEQNYFAMKQWFIRNPCKQAAIQVLNIEKMEVDHSDMKLSLPTEFRVSFPSGDNRTDYLSIFSPSHYLLPKIFRKLRKVVVLDHDVVVQRDLSPLWDLDMDGKVNGAVKSCSVRLGQIKSLKRGSFDANACLWMSGLNVINLARWRELGVSETYQKFYKQVSFLKKNLKEKLCDSLCLFLVLVCGR